MSQIIMTKNINNNKIVTNKNCLSNRSNFNSSCSLGGFKNNNLSHKNCVTNKFITRNRDNTSCYNCRPNNKFSSVDNYSDNNSSEILLFEIKMKKHV